MKRRRGDAEKPGWQARATLGSLTDLDSLVAEVGSSYPLVAYPADADTADERGAMDAMILAGLVKP